MPEGVEEGILKGIYKFKTYEAKNDYKVKLLGSGTILEQVRLAAEILANDYGIASELYSATSYNELAREAQNVERDNLLNIYAEDKIAYVDQVLGSDDENNKTSLSKGDLYEHTWNKIRDIKEIDSILERTVLLVSLVLTSVAKAKKTIADATITPP